MVDRFAQIEWLPLRLNLCVFCLSGPFYRHAKRKMIFFALTACITKKCTYNPHP